jgi:hypothetical protein
MESRRHDGSGSQGRSKRHRGWVLRRVQSQTRRTKQSFKRCLKYFTFPPLCQLDVFLEKHPGILAQDRPGRLGSGICMQSTGVDCRDLATCHCSIIKTVQSLHDSRTCLEVYLNQKSFLVAQSTSPHFKSLGISSHLASGIKRGPAGSRRCICILEATLVDIRRAGRRA